MPQSDNLEALAPFLNEIIASVSPRERRRLLDKLMRMARRANAKRITANKEPDGAAMKPRKPRPESRTPKKSAPKNSTKTRTPKKRGKMFKNIGKARNLNIRLSADEGALVFGNGLVGYTAAAHHYGKVDFVGKTKAGRVIRTKYDARRLLGHGAEASEYLDEVLKHMRF